MNIGTIEPMRPKARGLDQHGGPLAGVKSPGRCDFVHDGRAVPPAFSVLYSVQVALTGAAQLRDDGNFQLLLYSKCTQPSLMSWSGTLVDPCRQSDWNLTSKLIKVSAKRSELTLEFPF